MNTNCLENMQCPRCKSTEPFKIAISTLALVYDDGIDACYSDQDRDSDSYCERYNCQYYEIVNDFYIT